MIRNEFLERVRLKLLLEITAQFINSLLPNLFHFGIQFGKLLQAHSLQLRILVNIIIVIGAIQLYIGQTMIDQMLQASDIGSVMLLLVLDVHRARLAPIRHVRRASLLLQVI